MLSIICYRDSMQVIKKSLSLPLSLSHAALYCYILSITLLPIGFGGNRDLPLGLCQFGLAISAILLAFEKKIIAECFWPKRIITALGLFGLVILWGFLQTQSFMPQAWHHPLWVDAAQALNHPLPGSIALWHDEAFFSINRLLTYIAAGVLAYVFAQDASRATLMLQALWYSGIALCIYGYFNYAMGIEKVLWVDKPQYDGDLTSTFMSKNHFAIYAVLVMVCGAALLYQSWRHTLRDLSKKTVMKGLVRWAGEKGYVQFFLILVVTGAVILTHSRSGTILTMAGLATFFVAYQIYAKQFKKAFFLLVLSICTGAGALILASQSSDYFATLFMDRSTGDRLAVYRLCLEAIAANPLLGYGMGSFQAVFRMYNQHIAWSFDQAHSDILESLVDLGIPATMLLCSAVALLLSGILRGLFKRRRHGMFPALALAGSVVVIAHSSMDFSLQIPGVAMPFAMVLGIGLAQSWGSSEKA